jgi:hypothetical protein
VIEAMDKDPEEFADIRAMIGSSRSQRARSSSEPSSVKWFDRRMT